MELNYDADCRIDESALDVEWLEQPSLHNTYAKNYAYCSKVEMRAKENVEIVRCELAKDIRENPGKYNIDKLTEKAIELNIALCKDYKEAMSEYIEAKSEALYAKLSVDVMGDSRKKSLENLVKLHNANYFAGPSAPRNLSKERSSFHEHKEQVQKTASAIVARRRPR